MPETDSGQAALFGAESGAWRLLAVAGDPMLVLRSDGMIVFANPAFKALFGWSDEALSRNGLSRLLPEDLAARLPLDRVLRVLDRLTRIGHSVDLDATRADGDTLPIALRVAELALPGERRHYVLSIRDMVKRRKALHDLRLAERRHSQIIEMTDEAMIATDGDQNIIVFNRGAERMFGYRASDILGEPLGLLMPTGAAQRHPDWVRRFAEADLISRHAGDRGRIQGRRRSGEVFPAEASISRFEGAQGTIFTAMVRDLSERESAESEIQRIRQRLERVQKIAGLGYWEVDLRRGEFFMSTDLQAWLGINPGAGGWRAVLKSLPRDVRRNIFVALSTARSRRDHRPVEIDLRDRVLRLEHEIEHDGLGRPIRLTGTVLDVTQERRGEEALRTALGAAEEASRAKSAFLASVSHELRTPLHAIIGFTELMNGPGNSTLPEAFKGYMTDVLGSARHLLELINQLLDLSKLQLRHHILDEGAFRLVDPARVALRLVTHQASAAGVRLIRSIPADLVLLGDERAVAHMMRTLLGTAVRFCGSGDKVTLTAALDGDCVTISVIDTGAGIPAEDLAHVTEPFHEMRSEVMRQHVGTALAMATVKGLVELHGGDFRIASEPGKGTRVDIRFPPDRSIPG